jgi:hypothetical protein
VAELLPFIFLKKETPFAAATDGIHCFSFSNFNFGLPSF